MNQNFIHPLIVCEYDVLQPGQSPALRDKLEEFHSVGAEIYLLTDDNQDNAEKYLLDCDGLADGIICKNTFNRTKARADYWFMLEQKFKRSPEQFIFIDQSRALIGQAMRYGMHTLLVPPGQDASISAGDLEILYRRVSKRLNPWMGL